jgi:FlaA1/EpsC-like NDP-sugar epimerase
MNLIGKRIMIFGGTGSLGKKLISRFFQSNNVAVYSRDEAKHWTIKNELRSHYEVKNLEFFVGDVRDKDRVREAIRLYKPTHIIIAAALKQVDTCELSPGESIATNVTGTQNVIAVVNDLQYPDVEAVLFVSTDKACAPVNVYGMCKSISERIVTSQTGHGRSKTKFLAVRYGNVLESRGSIIPLFKYQAENNDFLTVTDPEMTRYVMTLDDSVNLIEFAMLNGVSGETWIPKLKAMKIGDLAEIFASIHKKRVKVVGHRPGEKKHEDLINESESVRTRDIKTHFVILPALTLGTGQRFTYSSDQNVMTPEELRVHLAELNIIDRPSSSFEGKNIEEICK